MAIEADSLRNITTIAASIPARPTDSAVHPPLVLYIARVPGSRDVFLTTLKPRQHVVNAQDIQSSLYYLHVHDCHEVENVPEAIPSEYQPGAPSSPLQENRHVISSRQPLHSVCRKPLPTPPTSPDLSSPAGSGIESFGTHTGVKRKPLPTRTGTGDRSSDTKRPARACTFTNDVTSTIVTLIRRDPGSGEQWNVATLNLPPNTLKAVDTGVDIRMTNSAYQPFKSSGETRHAGEQRGDNVTSDADGDKDAVFMRRLETQLYLTGDSHRYSHHGASKGYTFQTPWSTKCELSTGATGRSYKCRHQKQSIAGIESTVISELRFDLPALGKRSIAESSTSDSSGPHPPQPAPGHRAARSDRIAAIKEWTQKGLPVQELDYSLGREAAGGGLIGRRAKLGKLIIEGQGLQMLDLMVAVNMSLWWKAYERTLR